MADLTKHKLEDVIAGAAVRDRNGKIIDTNYAKKVEVLAETNRATAAETTINEKLNGLPATIVVSDETNPEFNSQENKISLLSFVDNNGTTRTSDNTKTGDTVLVEETDVPDRWVSGKTMDSLTIDMKGNSVLNEDETISSVGTKTTQETMTLDTIMEIINAGTASDNFMIGDQMNIPYTYNGTAYDCPINVVDYTDCETEDGTTHKALTMEWQYTTPVNVQFDPPEAMATVSSNGMPAGTYYFANGTTYIQFTLESALTEGMQLRPSSITVAGSLYVYADGKTQTATYTVATSLGSEGTFLGSLGGTDTSDTAKSYLQYQAINGANRYLNHKDAIMYGNNRWKYSYLRQYLNSEGTDYWVQQHCWDRAPSSITQGLLSGIPSEFRSKLKPTKIETPVNTAWYGSSISNDITYDKIFLHSKKEMCWVADGDETNNAQWEYYRELADSVVGEGKDFQNYSTYASLIHYAVNATTSAQYVWSRCPRRGYASNVWYVSPSGICNDSYANHSSRALPAWKLINN